MFLDALADDGVINLVFLRIIRLMMLHQLAQKNVTDLDYTGGAPMSPGQNCVAGGGVLGKKERKESRSIGLG
jgi:hypothetical protein